MDSELTWFSNLFTSLTKRSSLAGLLRKLTRFDVELLVGRTGELRADDVELVDDVVFVVMYRLLKELAGLVSLGVWSGLGSVFIMLLNGGACGVVGIFGSGWIAI